MEVLQKILKRTIIRSSNSTPGYLSKENKNINFKKIHAALCSLQHYLQQSSYGLHSTGTIPRREKNLKKNICISESLY